jgi:peptidoglycan/xylan/chitin deacetylase (PgdA/CDA1 family)
MKLLPNIILNFHAIKEPKWFENILKIIQRLYNPVNYEDIENYYLNGKTLKHACHITFDDGHVSFYNVVFPLLKKHNIPASIFVSPKIITERTNFWFQEIDDYDFEVFNKLINKRFEFTSNENIPVFVKLKSLQINEIWEIIHTYQAQTNTPPKSCVNMDIQQIREIHQSGLVNIGAHTMTHPILKNENDDSVKYEIGNSISELSELLNKPIYSFAYPNGKPGFDFGKREIEFLKNNNIRLAFTTEERTLRLNDSLLNIPRSGFEGGSTPYIYSKLFLMNNVGWLKKLVGKKDEQSYRSYIAKQHHHIIQ